MKARDFQARLLAEPDIIDAVPQAGQVRLVARDSQTQASQPGNRTFAGVAAQPTPARFEDGFMVLLHQTGAGNHSGPLESRDPVIAGSREEVAVEVNGLSRRFGKFVAVDNVNFNVKRGEIFGLLGPNGAGKTTTFRMLCGLLPASSGTLKIAGTDVRRDRASARQHLGYVAQKFSLYGQLTVGENLDFFARAYGLGGDQKRQRIAWAMSQFKLESFAHLPSVQLPGGFKQRLAMAAALLHRPEILFLDEPTSGADPFARREFWQRITALAANGVTVIVTTHFMPEAEYCDRAAILDSGRILAQGTPAELRAHAPTTGGRAQTIEDAFVAIVSEGRGKKADQLGVSAS
jgi:ABC-2 type transport system ATP-binding protein